MRTDPFFTETQWLPKGDLNILGESLAADRLTFFDHTSVGYAQFKNASLPSAAAGDQAVSHLPWEANDRQGARAVTRNEFDLPVELGVIKVVPYVLGEVGYWGEDINGDQLLGAATTRPASGPTLPPLGLTDSPLSRERAMERAWAGQ